MLPTITGILLIYYVVILCLVAIIKMWSDDEEQDRLIIVRCVGGPIFCSIFVVKCLMWVVAYVIVHGITLALDVIELIERDCTTFWRIK